MALSSVPCRVCGQAIQGVDAYVVCSACLQGLEMRFRERVGDGVDHLPVIVGDVEARLRQLLDDW